MVSDSRHMDFALVLDNAVILTILKSGAVLLGPTQREKIECNMVISLEKKNTLLC